MFAFHGCCSLKEIFLPPTVTQIEWSAFIGCKSLEKISIPESVENVYRHTFFIVNISKTKLRIYNILICSEC